jgi:hypothetical protein
MHVLIPTNSFSSMSQPIRCRWPGAEEEIGAGSPHKREVWLTEELKTDSVGSLIIFCLECFVCLMSEKLTPQRSIVFATDV